MGLGGVTGRREEVRGGEVGVQTRPRLAVEVVPLGSVTR